MELGEAGPGVEVRAAAVADAACELADTATPTAWSTSAVEDALDAIDVLAAALAAIGPEAERILAQVPAASAALRRHLAPHRPLETAAWGRPKHQGGQGGAAGSGPYGKVCGPPPDPGAARSVRCVGTIAVGRGLRFLCGPGCARGSPSVLSVVGEVDEDVAVGVVGGLVEMFVGEEGR